MKSSEKFVRKVAKTDAEWRKQLTPDQYHVTREHGTALKFRPGRGTTEER